MNYKRYLPYIILVLLSVASGYHFSTTKEYGVSQKELKHFTNVKRLDTYVHKFDQNKTFGVFWDMEDEKFEPLEDQNSSLQKSIKVKLDSEKNIICIDESCNRLLAIKFIGKVAYVVFYNDKLEKKIFSLKKGDLLESSLEVENIRNNKVFMSQPQTQNKWTLELFDVNQTKYLPKDKNETKAL